MGSRPVHERYLLQVRAILVNDVMVIPLTYRGMSGVVRHFYSGCVVM
jgi:hypothetical protein